MVALTVMGTLDPTLSPLFLRLALVDPTALTATLRCISVELFVVEVLLRLLGDGCRPATYRRVVLLDELQRVPEVALGVLEEVERGPSWRTVVATVLVPVGMLLPCAVDVELAALVVHRVIFFMLIEGHNDVLVNLACHFR